MDVARPSAAAAPSEADVLRTVRARLPLELSALVCDYLRYPVTRVLCRTSNEMRRARHRAPTISAHAVHLAIQRFHWRWVVDPARRTLSARSVPLDSGATPYAPWTRLREAHFVWDTLRFHRKWTGPDVPYEEYRCGDVRVPAGWHRGPL